MIYNPKTFPLYFFILVFLASVNQVAYFWALDIFFSHFYLLVSLEVLDYEVFGFVYFKLWSLSSSFSL